MFTYKRCIVFIIIVVAFFFTHAFSLENNRSYTSGSAKLFGAVENKIPYTGQRLFSVLDSVGGSGTWMEWDVNGIKDPSLMEVLNPLLNSKNVPKMVWVITERTKPLVAVLLAKGNGEVLVFYELKNLDANPQKLSVNVVLNPEVVFRDYKKISESEYVHLDKPNLKVALLKKGILFTYQKSGEEALYLDKEYAQKTEAERSQILMDYMDFFKYEYSLMLRAFVQSTRGIFNFQPWHWYMANWNKNYMLKSSELDAVLRRGIMPSNLTIFKAKTDAGEIVEFKTNGSGYSELLITKP